MDHPKDALASALFHTKKNIPISKTSRSLSLNHPSLSLYIPEPKRRAAGKQGPKDGTDWLRCKGSDQMSLHKEGTETSVSDGMLGAAILTALK